MSLWRSRKLKWLLVAGAVVLLLSCRLIYHLARTAIHDKEARETLPVGFVSDHGRLDQTHVADVIEVPEAEDEAQRIVRSALQRARAEGLRISIAGARHSMGGQTVYPEGIQLDMLPHDGMELDPARGILHVQSGARWSAIIPYLDDRGWSVAVMQSNNPFTVGGSISVNAHGWQADRPPIASTVESFGIMKADGSLIQCNRNRNSELFSLALGGYGLFGVIMDVDLRLVPNELYQLRTKIVPTTRYADEFDRLARQSEDAAMAFGRLSIETSPDRFLREASLNVFYRVAAPKNGKFPALRDPEMEDLVRWVFRGSVGSDYGKKVRWESEKRIEPLLQRKVFSRNQILNQGIEIYENRSADSTDILHEYFIPPEHFEDFLERCRAIIPAHRADLLNVTIRDLREDKDTFLRYATGDMFAFVMLFNLKRTGEADLAMSAMTRELADAAIGLGGRFYLPYRLHATREQTLSAYPQARRFFELKRKHDPEEIFQNQLYAKYGRL